MIPLKDNIPSKSTPVVTYVLIALNVAAFVLEMRLAPAQLDQAVQVLGFVPTDFFHRIDDGAYIVAGLPILTSMFLHAGWLHLGGNMLFLYIFGDNVEDRLGRARYLLLYLLAGAAGALAQAYSAPRADFPMIGASAAIAGVLGTYFVMFPRARVLTLVPMLVLFPIIPIRAVWFLGIWIVVQVVYGGIALGAAEPTGGVAWLAHASGFLLGLAMAPMLGRRRTTAAELRQL